MNDLKEQSEPFNIVLITARKRSLGQGNVFAGDCLSTGGSLFDVTSCLADWSNVPFGGSLSLVQCSFWGGGGSVQGRFLSRGFLSGGLCPRGGGLCPGDGVSVRGSLSGGSVQGDPPDRDPPYSDERAVCILLECFLV